ncbi:MAG: KH domain-containing protein [Candidatus Thermoplasmatota archaeon]|nr:KH domain-containing protein [Candidatus Thermoplasmatota archaeon]MEC7436868.1 KH domain-containing protein [Candidatus Thermoplasmatota archaeon]MEC7462852.1 KH domain-containing protein [Candidatus Thermoplasmatota archaeon]MEC7544764.1 KH domain-containing protein [Candidatus Thermoplasmatota archaeon]MEC8383899.1 KH domain-containing protein [Candidatus Thermoplasmatota archaeon]|tara:strand:- start:8287 stop:9018 length:732 start_codon:yes stop_codon:yes gene_type:complete
MELLARIAKDRIGVLIGKSGETKLEIENAAQCTLHIDSDTGEVNAKWSEESDPIVRIKMPDVIRAIGRGMAPSRAITLLEDDVHLKMYDIREWVGRQPNQIKRMRGRIIGRNGRIRELIEELSGVELVVYRSTVVVVGDVDSLTIGSAAVERVLSGAEHGTVLKYLESERRRQRVERQTLAMHEQRQSTTSSGFDALVPGLAAARERRNERRFKASQVDPEDTDAVNEMMELAGDESINWEEE